MTDVEEKKKAPRTKNIFFSLHLTDGLLTLQPQLKRSIQSLILLQPMLTDLSGYRTLLNLSFPKSYPEHVSKEIPQLSGSLPLSAKIFWAFSKA